MNSDYQKVNELIKDIKMVMLTTQSEGGSMHSRPMTTQQVDEKGDIWFFTGDDTSQASEVSNKPAINLAFANPEKGSYVSVAGQASIVRDSAKMKELWNPVMKAWFPKGLEDPSLVLMKVRVESAEYWDAPQGRMVQLFKIVSAAVSGQTYDSKKEEHGKTSFR